MRGDLKVLKLADSYIWKHRYRMTNAKRLLCTAHILYGGHVEQMLHQDPKFDLGLLGV